MEDTLAPWSADFSIVGITWDNQLVPEASPKKDQSLFSLYMFQLDLHQKKVKSKVFYSFHFVPTPNVKTIIKLYILSLSLSASSDLFLHCSNRCHRSCRAALLPRRRWGAGRPVVAVTNDRNLRRKAAQQGLETPEAQRLGVFWDGNFYEFLRASS